MRWTGTRADSSIVLSWLHSIDSSNFCKHAEESSLLGRSMNLRMDTTQVVVSSLQVQGTLLCAVLENGVRMRTGK